MASYNQLAQLQSADTQNQLAQMQMQESRQLAPLRLQEQQSRAASTKMAYDKAVEAHNFVSSVMAKAAEHPDAPTDPMMAAREMIMDPREEVSAVGRRLYESAKIMQTYENQIANEKAYAEDQRTGGAAPAPAAVARSANDVGGSLTAPGAAAAPVGFNTSARLIQPEGKSYADMSNTERIQFDVARLQNPQLGQPQAVYTLDGKEVPFREYVNANIANSTFKPDNALAAAVASDVAAAPAVNAMIPAVASALQNADALKKEIEKGDEKYARGGIPTPGWKSKRELLVEAYKQALKPGRTDTTFAAINPSDYTQDSVKAFLVSKNYGDLVPKAGKADKLVGAVNPSDYTPASIAAFNLSGNYGDLVAKAGKTDKLIGNVNPSDYTSESVAAFSLSNNYSDLVLKPSKADKADKTIANVNPDSYTPASVAAFALSGNYADLVLRPEKAKDSKNIANVNPNDFTPASIEKFVASGKYSDLVPVKKASEGGAAKDDPKTTAAFREVDAAGNVTFYNKFGNPISTQKGAGKPSATFEKTTAQRKQLSSDLTTAITELTEVTKDGGLIDQSTGSGAGRLVDIAARFGGKATAGDIAIGKLQPVADLALKMVTRFEGPQSNADTISYKQAAGQLADPTLPAAIRKEAGKTVLRLMIKRKGQFVTQSMADENTVPGNGAPAANVDALLDKYK
jgi:hypothetical protein